MSIQKKQRAYIISLLFLAVVTASALYYKNARVASGSHTASIEITIPDQGSRVFLDNKQKTTTTVKNQKIVFKKLDQRVHNILVDSPGSYPWYKTFDLVKEKFPVLTSYSVSTILSKTDISANDPKYQSIKTVIQKTALPSKTSKKRSADGNVDLWVDATMNSIHAEWIGDKNNLPRFFCPLGICSPTIVVFNSKTTISSADFYKNRADVIIVALDTSISALELDVSPPQNFQPIFTGAAPRFHQPESGILFIESGQTLSIVRY